MCGRFTQDFSYADLHAYFEFFGHPLGNLEPRYNICPTQQVIAALPADANKHSLEHLRWGLIPSWWSKPVKELPATFNARSETVDQKPTFRAAYQSRRCVIPASGTYEWQDTDTGKQPWYFTPAKGPLLLIAALWESWRDPNSPAHIIKSTTMIITAANGFVGQYHDRMPALLTPESMPLWLAGSADKELFQPAPNDTLKASPVARTINSSRAKDERELIAPIQLQKQQKLL